MEAIVRENGAMPATIALLDGEILVGVDDAQLERLADPAARPLKVSSRDLANVLVSVGGGGGVEKALACYRNVLEAQQLPRLCKLVRMAKTVARNLEPRRRLPLLAHAANIRVFATGGIGGVHRGASSSRLQYFALKKQTIAAVLSKASTSPPILSRFRVIRSPSFVRVQSRFWTFQKRLSCSKRWAFRS